MWQARVAAKTRPRQEGGPRTTDKHITGAMLAGELDERPGSPNISVRFDDGIGGDRPRRAGSDDADRNSRTGRSEGARCGSVGRAYGGAILAGLSTRRYPAALKRVGAAIETEALGRSKSSVLRPFVRATTGQVASLMSRRLDNERWLIMFIDGFTFGNHMLVAAVV